MKQKRMITNRVMLKFGGSYLKPALGPPRGGAPIVDLDDLVDDLVIPFDPKVIEECRTIPADRLLQVGVTPSGHRLMLYRSHRPNPGSIELLSITGYPVSWREPFIRSVELFREIDRFLAERYPNGFEDRIVPLKHNIYAALHACPFDQVKVVIMGQDPYTTEIDGEPIGTGVAFAIRKGLRLKGLRAGSSLTGILAEVKREYPNFRYDDTNCSLEGWLRQGVLPLNASLTGERGSNDKANSHKGKWRDFIYNILTYLVNNKKFCVFLAWGNEAKDIIGKVEMGNSFKVLTSAHPSGLATNAANPFFGNNHFSLCNESLIANGHTPIDWTEIT